MAKDPAFLFYPGDYLRDTQCLSEKSQVAYDRIMCEHMRNIVVSKDKVDFFTKGMDEAEKKYLLSLMVKKKDGFQIDWVAESISKRIAYSESRRKNRAKSHDDHMFNTGKHMENENEIVNENINEGEVEQEKGVRGKNESVAAAEPAHPLQAFIENLPNVKRLGPITTIQAQTLEKKFPAEIIMDVLEAMENHKGLAKKYTSCYLTITSWCRRRMDDRGENGISNRRFQFVKTMQELNDPEIHKAVMNLFPAKT